MSDKERPRDGGLLTRLWHSLGDVEALAPVLPHLIALTALVPKVLARAGEIAEGVEVEGGDQLGAAMEEVGRRAAAVVDALWDKDESLLLVGEGLSGLASKVSSDPRLSAALEAVKGRAMASADAALERAVAAAIKGERGPGRGIAVAEVILQKLLERLVESAFPASSTESVPKGREQE